MDDTKNLILAVVLMFGVMFIYNMAFQEEAVLPPANEVESTLPSSPGSTEGQIVSDDTAAPIEVTAGPSPRIDIDAARVSGTLALRGARIDDIVLKDHFETLAREKNIRVLTPVENGGGYFAEFGWVAAGAGQAMPDANTLWQTSDSYLSEDNPVTLTWDNGTGLRFVRTITVDENYAFTVLDRVESIASAAVTLSPYSSITRINEPDTAGFAILHDNGHLTLFTDRAYPDPRHQPKYKVFLSPSSGHRPVPSRLYRGRASIVAGRCGRKHNPPVRGRQGGQCHRRL